ncbi:MAG: pseudouridine synthase [Culicoidibacterales bacterium]
MRLDKYLADCNIGTRSDVKKYIASKRVVVNGKVTTSPKVHVKEEDYITFDGKVVHYEQFHYLMLNKPEGVLSATKDGKTQTVIDLLDIADRWDGLFPVGRLDKDTTGLILLTDNGQLAHAMLHPKKHVQKKYTAKITPALLEGACEQFEQGIVLADGTKCLPAQLTLGEINEEDEQIVYIQIEEGKFHQIKRMIAACGSHVVKLHRDQIGTLELDAELQEGMYRYLDENEITQLLKGSNMYD